MSLFDRPFVEDDSHLQGVDEDALRTELQELTQQYIAAHLPSYEQILEDPDCLRTVTKEVQALVARHTMDRRLSVVRANMAYAQQRFEDGLVGLPEMSILDLCTPHYLGIIESLSEFEQGVVHAFSHVLNNQSTTRRISEIMRIEVKTISSYLDRLCQKGVLSKEKVGSAPFRFSVGDQRFYHWLIMRYNREYRRTNVQRSQQRLSLLAVSEFLESIEVKDR
ncbi:MAG: hypothetical protein ACD_28C00283G0003 [uncultured bacterium]|nr:MAG: hypothetical protein ACD_28C00283G0003 [uncultured bacterium]